MFSGPALANVAVFEIQWWSPGDVLGSPDHSISALGGTVLIPGRDVSGEGRKEGKVKKKIRR